MLHPQTNGYTEKAANTINLKYSPTLTYL